MPDAHARLSPSSAERWIECPGSVVLSEQFAGEDDSSVWAEEGTLAHKLGELKGRLAFDKITEAEYQAEREEFVAELARFLEKPGDDLLVVETLAEMDRHTDAYVDLIVERSQIYPNTQVLFEQRMDTGVPSSWGTSDTVLFSPVHVEIIDFKYGQGVEVQAVGNAQLKLYALGALDTYGDVLGDTETIRWTVHQPRLNHVLTDECTPEYLRAWRDLIATPAAEEALAPGAHFSPTDEACRWCPASGRCRAQLEAVFATDFDTEPTALEPEEMGRVLDRVPLIKTWLKAFEEAALDLAYTKEIPIPGYKVVRSGGKRSIPDEEGAGKFLLENTKLTEDQVFRKKLATMGDLEKLVGKKEFAELLKDYIRPGEGRPSLAPESDDRPAINRNTDAASDFADGMELL